LYIFIPLFARVLFHDLENWDLSIRKVVVFQLDAIAYGVLLVYVMREYSLPPAWRSYLAVAGFFVIFCSVAWWWGSEHQFNVRLAFNKVFILNFILVGLCMIFPWVLHVRCNNSRVVRLVEWLSDTSYAVYLVHLTAAGWC